MRLTRHISTVFVTILLKFSPSSRSLNALERVPLPSCSIFILIHRQGKAVCILLVRRTLIGCHALECSSRSVKFQFSPILYDTTDLISDNLPVYILLNCWVGVEEVHFYIKTDVYWPVMRRAMWVEQKIAEIHKFDSLQRRTTSATGGHALIDA